VNVDWEAGHGPVTGPLNIAGATLAAAWAGHVAHMPPMWAAATAGAGLLGHHLAGVRQRGTHHITGTSLAVRAATWAGAGTWCSWAMATSPWTTTSLGTLAAGTIGLGMAWTGEARTGRATAQAAADQQATDIANAAQALRTELAAEWTARIGRVCAVHNTTVLAIEQWDSGGGYTLEIVPPGGTTWRQLKPFEDRLAGDARLPEGCGVEVTAGADRGTALVNVATVNHLLDDVPYPMDFSPLSINDFTAIGVYQDGEKAGAVMRQASSVTVGQRGSGKSNLMNVKIANQLRMVDNLVWVIDLNGGNLALPWLHLWTQLGKPGKPPVDWVADTPEKALAMTEAMKRIAKIRKTAYKALELQANDDKLPVTPRIPALTLNNDEIAMLFSQRARRDEILRKVGDNIVEIIEIGRATACNVENAALRATQDVIAEPQVLKQSIMKIGLGVDTEAELNYLFGWNERLKPEDAPYEGCGFLKFGRKHARPFKTYLMKPDIMMALIQEVSTRRPELDAASRKVAGEAYERRWDNTDHLFLIDVQDPDSILAGIMDAVPPQAGPTTDGNSTPRRSVTADWDSTPPAGSAADAIAAAEETRNRVRGAMNETTSHDADLDRQFREILGEGGALWKPPAHLTPESAPAPKQATGPTPTPGVSDDARWPTVFSIVVKAGPSGIGPDAIRELFAVIFPVAPAPSRSAITDWLKAEPQFYKPMRGAYAHVKHRTDAPEEQQ
jgi:hypothetical protein